MNCNVCNTELKENELFCSNCGEQVALNNQKNEVEKAKNNAKNILLEIFSNKMSLVYFIFLSIVTVFSFVSTINCLINRNWIMLIISLSSFTAALFTTINGWKLYAKKADNPGKSISKLGDYCKFLKAMSIVGLVFTCIVSFILLLLGGIVSAAADIAGDFIGGLAEIAGSLDAETADLVFKFEGIIKDVGFVIMLVIAFVCSLLIFIVVNLMKTYSNTKAFYQVLGKSYTQGEYDINVKVPVVRSYIFGSILAIFGVTTIISNWSVGLLFISIAAYTFISGLLFNTLHNAEVANMQVVQAEINKYNAIEAEVKKFIAEQERAKKAEADLKEQELRMAQQQQQIMMQQLMQQMMEQQNKKDDPDKKDE